MQRHRQVAAAPHRKASETWEAIEKLVTSTLERSPRITGKDVAAALKAASPVGIMLVAGGHLDKHPVVVVADPVYLTISTVSGDAALSLDEDLGPVPGGTTVTEWTVYLPTPDPVGDAVRSAITGAAHLSADEPPGESTTKAARLSEGSVLDLDALANRARESK